ncbi:MAG: hypothetical protein HYT63_00070 [Candidatus Yanofskybacteria bacterium]|nr:hypothetical protein [Candidatus Yanofskybacteria bacterium]
MENIKYLLDGQEPSDEKTGETPVESVASEETEEKKETETVETDSNV